MKNVCLFLVVAALLSTGIKCNEWEYKGKSGSAEWSSLAPACGHSSQSPINIPRNGLVPDKALGLLQLSGYSQTLDGGQFNNNGHSVQLDLPPDKLFRYSGAGNNGSYRAVQLHFHWRGSNSTTGGSEHTIDGGYYDAEMHIVHMKEPYTDPNDVKNMEDGFGVIAVFLQVQPNVADNAHFQSLLETAKMCQYKGDIANLTNGPTLMSLLPDSGSYYRYFGSLTTPPCYEAVQWSIYQQPVVISRQQLQMLQSLKVAPKSTGDSDGESANKDENDIDFHHEDDELSDNYRPAQALNGRVVTAYYDIKVSSTIEEPQGSWHYDGGKGPNNWSSDHDKCAGLKQSPIDLFANKTSKDTKKLEFSSSYKDKTTGTLYNNGHTVMYVPDDHQALDLFTADKTFSVLQLHFHWGAAFVNGNSITTTGGSEHTIGGKRFPIEMHIVHKKINPDENPGDDYGVLAVFFDFHNDDKRVSDKADKALEDLTKFFHNILYEDQQFELEEGPILRDLFPSNQSYYRYMGSLTTPPCSESVLWSIFSNPVYITKERFLEFQSIFRVKEDDVIELNSTRASVRNNTEPATSGIDHALLISNFRPVQLYQGRSVVLFVDEPIIVEPDVTAIVLWTLGGLVLFGSLLLAMVCCRKRGEKEERDSTVYKQVSTIQPGNELETLA